MSRLILDAMGGDHGPEILLDGVVLALPELRIQPGELLILGDEKIIQPLLKKRRYKVLADALVMEAQINAQPQGSHSSFQIHFVHTSENINMEDSIHSIRNNPTATVNVGCRLAAQTYAASRSSKLPNEVQFQQGIGPSAFISAGHSGAIMASALIEMGRLPHLKRPAIAIQLPTLNPDGCVLIDVGANVDCRPEQLKDFAMMGAIYAQVERKSHSLPIVALLSNGEERTKGNTLTRSAAKLIEKLPCFAPGPQAIGQFIGYAEGKEIFKGKVDVVVTDGFVGNVVLKSLEGLGSVTMTILKREALRNPLTSFGFLLSAGVFTRFKKRLDYAEYGAAPLLGVSGYVFVCHGQSNRKAIKNALLRARSAMNERYVERLEEALETASKPEVH